MAQLRINEQTLRRILKRQSEQRWGPAYDAAIHATPKEAPSISRARILTPQKLGGREMHLLSDAEFAAGLLALYHPLVFDINEQHMLSPEARDHPLHEHPYAQGIRLPVLRGTLVVANEMGRLTEHPKVYVTKPDDPGIWVPFPYLGDLLLFVLDEKGPFCVNWTVKDKHEKFTRRGTSDRPSRDVPDEGVIARHELEKRYFLDGDIKTIQVAGEDFKPEVINNLRDLFGFHRDLTPMSDTDRSKLETFFAKNVGASTPCIELLRQAQRDFGISEYHAKVVLKAGIWNRRILVDLHESVLMDRPLLPMRRDVIVDYTAWFHR